MKDTYLEVTYRKGRPIAAYYYLPRRSDDVSVRTERTVGGLVVDFTGDDRPIGVEITAPTRLDRAELDALLRRLGQSPIDPQDIAPLPAA